MFEVGEAGVEGLERLLGHGADEGEGDVGGREAYADLVFFHPPPRSQRRSLFFSPLFRGEKDLGFGKGAGGEGALGLLVDCVLRRGFCD